ncbi:MAG: electron transfer flavoprotein subunit beta/FixA family protein [Oscillospiraceae bacterium]|jgi:electron transfer flavoprotein alpha/beta subunit
MNILVCIKQVPNTTQIAIDETRNTIARDPEEAALNLLDGFTMELAARMKDQNPGSRIVLLSMGPMSAVKALKDCLAVGGDKAYLLCDESLRGADTYATSLALFRAIRHLEQTEGKFDLIFLSKNATDGDSGQMGPQLAHRLGLAQATYVTDASLGEAGSLLVQRQTEDGYERLALPLPSVLAVTKTAYEPRFPTVKSKLSATRAKVPVLSAADVGLAPEECGAEGSRTRVIAMEIPEKKASCHVIKEETDEESAKALFAMLNGAHVI